MKNSTSRSTECSPNIFAAIVLATIGLGLVGCSNKEADFNSGTGTPKADDGRSKKAPLDVETPVKQFQSPMVTGDPAPVPTAGGNPLGSSSSGSNTSLPSSPATNPGPSPSPVAGAKPSCQMLVSSARIHKDAGVQVAIYVTNAVRATVQGVAVSLDAQNHADIFYKNIQTDTVYKGVVKAADGQTADCSATVLVLGKWYKIAAQNCSTYCGTINATSAPDPQGSRCASGENYFNNLFNKHFNYYPYGTWGGGYGTTNTVSVGGYCYADPESSQRRDGDQTDISTGCYCWDKR